MPVTRAMIRKMLKSSWAATRLALNTRTGPGEALLERQGGEEREEHRGDHDVLAGEHRPENHKHADEVDPVSGEIHVGS